MKIMKISPNLEPHVKKKSIFSWDELYDEHLKLGKAVNKKWLFRGQPDSERGLETSLERAIRLFQHPSTSTATLEKGLIRRFIRQTHHYTTDLPDQDCKLEWLALMQHYGAPTRLQDWTYSFFVATYFAIDKADGKSAIWALDRTVIDQAIRHLLPPRTCKECIDDAGFIDTRQCFEEVFDRTPPIALVSPVNPFRLNERLVIQQGIFLCPGDVSRSFEENLATVLPRPPHDALLQFIVEDSADLRKEILRHLQRMNMNSATLFPGLDGFAKSLNTLVAFPDIIPPGN
jgi:hypothetical protein